MGETRDHSQKPTPQDQDLTEDYVVEMMLKATTRDEGVEARALADEYLRRFPGNRRVLTAGEQLHMITTAHEFLKKQG